MNILFIHPNMPGQYKHLARAFGAENKHRIFFVTKHKTMEIPGVNRVTYLVDKHPSPATHRYLHNAAQAVIEGQHAWRAFHLLKTQHGFVPDVIVAHPGWGGALFAKDIFPQAPLLSFCEFYYRATGADVGFEESSNEDDIARVRIKNTNNILNLEAADWCISPTYWQWSLQPSEFHSKFSVLHDGIDIKTCVPNPHASLTLPNGRTFKPGDELVTYIARNFEPYRGFPTFMKAAEILLRERPNCHIIAVGADDISYGKKAPEGTTYRKMWMEQTNLPRDRIHFVGMLPYSQLITLLQISAAHLYLTYPFVLSWSMMEAMACGVALVASRTKPVLEVVEDGVNGLLADFASPEDVAAKLGQLLDDPTRNVAMREAARKTILERYDLSKLLPLHMQLVRDLAAGQIPPQAAQTIRLMNPLPPADSPFLWSGK
jgi:glycosyltransferase involved in cell wall biosynthesis